MRCMRTTTSKSQVSVILWSLVWAVAMIAAALLLKGNPAKDWIESVLFVGAVTSILWNRERVTCR